MGWPLAKSEWDHGCETSYGCGLFVLVEGLKGAPEEIKASDKEPKSEEKPRPSEPETTGQSRSFSTGRVRWGDGRWHGPFQFLQTSQRRPAGGNSGWKQGDGNTH